MLLKTLIKNCRLNLCSIKLLLPKACVRMKRNELVILFQLQQKKIFLKSCSCQAGFETSHHLPDSFSGSPQSASSSFMFNRITVNLYFGAIFHSLMRSSHETEMIRNLAGKTGKVEQTGFSGQCD